MPLTSNDKAQVIKQFERSKQDTGSVEVQVSLFTKRIKYLTEHFKTHKKDFHSRRGLRVLVSKRQKLLRYIKRTGLPRYRKLIEKLGLRDSY